MLKLLHAIILLFLLLAPPATPAMAEGASPAPAAETGTVKIDKRKLLVQPRNADGTRMTTPFLEDPVMWVREQQQSFYGSLSAAIRAIKSRNPAEAAWTLMLLSFAYGVFHAAGPGHGKAVISAWLLATENELRRGIFVAFLSALFQALTAIVMVSVLLLLVASAGAVAKDLTGYLESASYALIAAMGLYLLVSVFRKSGHHVEAPALAMNEGTFAHPAFGENFVLPAESHTSSQHVHDASCGHAHAPGPGELKGDWSLWRGVSMAFAIGLRPCSGAILVLILANAIGLYWAGVAATLAMGLGTFITVATIAAIAIYAKALALRFAGGNSVLLGRLGLGMRIVGGLVILALGTILFLGSLGTTSTMT